MNEVADCLCWEGELDIHKGWLPSDGEVKHPMIVEDVDGRVAA